MINDNKNEFQNIKDQFNKKFNVAINQIENTKALELLSDDVIEKMDEEITPIYEMAKKFPFLKKDFPFLKKDFKLLCIGVNFRNIEFCFIILYTI